MIYQRVQFLRQLPVVILIIGVCLSVISCSEEPPLKIGFTSSLTGRVADLGVAARDAAILAIEEKNQSGGIAGRKIELVVRDNRQDAESARQAIRELIDEQVVAIVGPLTSSMATVVRPLINSAQIVTISPTAKADQLVGHDDFFLRLASPLSKSAKQLADYAINVLKLKKFAVAYDLSNRAFTEAWFNYFKKVVGENGGQITGTVEFTSSPSIHFLPIAKRLLETEPEGVLLLSSAINTALLAQQFRKLESEIALFASEWAFATDLIGFGGRAVNGMTAFLSYNSDSQDVRYLSFRERFTSRFGSTPSTATILTYDVMVYLLAGLENNPSRSGLKEALLKINSFQGLQSKITVDKYGDGERKLFLTVVEDGRFKVVE